MAAISDKVLYYTPETDTTPSVPVSAVVTAVQPTGHVLFLMGAFAIGYVIAQPSSAPLPGFFVEPTP